MIHPPIVLIIFLYFQGFWSWPCLKIYLWDPKSDWTLTNREQNTFISSRPLRLIMRLSFNWNTVPIAKCKESTHGVSNMSMRHLMISSALKEMGCVESVLVSKIKNQGINSLQKRQESTELSIKLRGASRGFNLRTCARESTIALFYSLKYHIT